MRPLITQVPLVKKVLSYGEFVEGIRSKLYEVHAICRKHLNQTAKIHNVCNTKTLVHKYKAGDIVWLMNEKIGDSECPKFRSVYIGPCVVLKVSLSF
jgi:hypothetical protein